MPADAPKSLTDALVALQAQLPRVTKTDTAQVGTRTYTYAGLADVHAALMPIMTALGLAWVCCPTMLDGRFVMRYELTHTSGESETGYYPLPESGTPQQVGSAITYARRYALLAVTGLAPVEDDDDAQKAEQAAQARFEREHAKLRQHPRDKPAERSRTEDPADPWYDQPPGEAPEVQPSSSNGKQHQQLGILYGQLKITDRAARLVDMSDRMGREITSAKDLSYAEAEQAIKELRALVAEEAKR